MIAITGASGLLGQSLVERFVTAGHSVVAVVRDNKTTFPGAVAVRQADVRDPFSLEEAFSGAKVVVHAAAMVSFNPRRRDEMFDINVIGTRNVVNTCLQLGIRQIVHISSVAALGRKPGEPIRESDSWTGQYANDYANSKHEAEMEIFRGSEEGITVSVVNPSLILSGLPLHRSSGTLFDYVWRQRPFYTKGHINYVDVRDVAEAVVSLADQPRPGERFTLCGGRVPFSEFFGEIARRWNRKAPSIAIPKGFAYLMGAAEEARCLLNGREPMVTRQSARLASHSFRYDTARSTDALGLRYRSLSETLDWCCAVYAQHVNGNK